MSFYVFSLPSDLLNTLVPRTLVEPTPRVPSPPLASRPSGPTTGSKSCNICLAASFADVDDQRTHFRSDWHRYNVKLRLRGAEVVNEAQFASLIEGEITSYIYELHSFTPGLEDSLSGSASEDDDEESEDSSPDAVRALLSKTRRSTRPESPMSTIPNPPRTALTWFHSPPSTQIGIYNALFPLKLPQASYLAVLKDMQRGGPNGRRWTMLMVAGGHFAGLVVQVHRPDETDAEKDLAGGKKKSKLKPEVEVIKHKTFHRYTSQPFCFRLQQIHPYTLVQRGGNKEAHNL